MTKINRCGLPRRNIFSDIAKCYPARRLRFHSKSIFSSLLIAAALLLSVSAYAGVVYVNADALGNRKGDSWKKAYTDLNNALTNATEGDEIWVAEGSYKPGETRADTFQLRNNIAIYGGFFGTERSRDQRGHSVYITTLDGDLLGDDYSRFVNGHAVWSNAGDNSHHIVTGSGVGATAVLDGFVIAHGYAWPNGFEGPEIHAGGGMIIRNGSPTIRNTRIDGSSGSYGGGAYVGQGSAPSFTNCEFLENNSDIGYGGAMHIAGSSSVAFSNCHFEGNAAIGTQSPAGSGGALYVNFGSSATITGSSFVRNITGYRTYTTGGASTTTGGAIMAGGDIVVRDSTFIGNRSYMGGAIYAYNSATLINNIFNGNSVTTAPGSAGGGYGGALILTGPSTLINNTVTNNRATEGTGGVIASVAEGESVQITNTILWGNTVSKHIPVEEDPLPVSRNQLARSGDVSMSYGILEGLLEPIPGEDPVDPANFPGVLDADPLFVSSTGLDGYKGNEDDDLHLGAGSPAIDSGDNSAVAVGVTTDIDGDPRFQNDLATADTGNGSAPIVDMGVYEFVGIPGTNISPVAVASATPESGEAPLDVQLSSAGSGDSDGDIVAYDWDFGDGNVSTAENPQHTYQAGTYTASLTVTDNLGGTHTDTVVITATDVSSGQAPVAIVSSDWIAGEAVAPLLVEFNGSKSTDNSQIVSYAWDFGDGSTSTGTEDTIKHTFGSGTYTITLTVTDDEGATDVATVTITVDPDTGANQAPVAVASSDWAAGGVAPLVVGFDGSSSYDNDGTIDLYSWEFGDGSASETGIAVAHPYNSGTFTVTLITTDNDGATSTDTITIIVDDPSTPPPANIAPVADTSATATSVTISKGKSTTVTLDGSKSSDSDGSIVSYIWHEGSSVIGEGMTLGVNRKEDTYTFSLIVTDDKDASSINTFVTVTVTKGVSDGGGPQCNKKNPC
jgi:PKD repeat protein